MATPRKGPRGTRKLRQWTVEQVESGKFPGLVWDDAPAKTMFRIPWKHAGKHEFRHDEDAGFFKAWAIFKGKYRPGEQLNPAAWKTRIRCALSKSPEFKEVPERSRLDIAEPYKVYRLVPMSEQALGCQSKAEKSKKAKVGRSKKANDPTDSTAQSAGSLTVLKMEESWGPEATASHTPNTLELSTFQTGENSPQPGETAPEVNHNVFPLNLDPLSPVGINGMEIGEYSIVLSIFYSGKLMKRHWIPAGEFLITSVAASLEAPTNCMTRVVLPPNVLEEPQKREAISHLLKNLERGVMAASNSEGIFIQSRGKANIFWQGPVGPVPHGKLENNAYLQLFSTRSFRTAWEQFQLGLGPAPQYQITLSIGQELGEQESIDNKLIIIQMEQIIAIRLLSPAPLSPTTGATLP